MSSITPNLGLVKPTDLEEADVTTINDNMDTIDRAFAALMDRIYPVGSIYMSINNTSPEQLFGGTWVALEGRMLIGADGTYPAGSTGGSKTSSLVANNIPSHSHTYDKVKSPTGSTAITVDQMPSHNHGNRDIYAVAYFADNVILNNQGKVIDSTGGSFSASSRSHAGVYDTGSISVATTANRNDVLTLYSQHTHDSNGGNQGHTHTNSTFSTNTGNTGSGSAFNTISPYLAVYMWKRVA